MHKKTIILSLLVLLLIQYSYAQNIKKCPKCNTTFPEKYIYCPYDGNKLIIEKVEIKDIDGFQNLKWGMSINEIQDYLNNRNISIDSSIADFKNIKVLDFTFQGKESMQQLDFYKNKLYKISVHFMVADNIAGMNEYFKMGELISNLYGKSKATAIGRESDDYNHRATQISIGNLSYQYTWKSASGSLVFQLAGGNSNTFICSLFYRSIHSDEIDKRKTLSEF